MNPLLPAALIVVLCHPLGIGLDSCIEKTIIGNVQAPMAGKTIDPIPMLELNAMECEILAPQIITAWLDDNPQYQLWSVHGWKCPTPEPLPSHKG